MDAKLKRDWIAVLGDPSMDWRMLRTFMTVADVGTFRAASADGRLALNTMRSHIGRIEQLTGRKLFERSISGVVPTSDGEAVLRVIRAMDHACSASIQLELASETACLGGQHFADAMGEDANRLA